MIRRFGYAFAGLIVCLGIAGPIRRDRTSPGPQITYHLTPHPPSAASPARTTVEIRIDNPSAGTPIQFAMPAWTPGDYRIQDHGRSVRNLRVFDGGPIPVRDAGAGRWAITPRSSQPVTLTYDLPNTRPGLFTENVDVQRDVAFYNGAAVFLYFVGRTNEPVSLRITSPPRFDPPCVPLKLEGDGSFTAPSYHALADTPILLGRRTEGRFVVSGREHRVEAFGRDRRTAIDPYVEILRRIVHAGDAYMGGLPYARYYLFLDMDGRGGGLEHADSARLAIPWQAPPGMMARFIAHEFFHLWNVKRIRPKELAEIDYSRAAITPNLWFCEGVTEYVAGILSVRAGLMTEEEYESALAQSAAAWGRSSRGRRTTADDASRRIWSGGTSMGSGGVSVYLSGEMIGLCLDLELLRRTNGAAGLRELLRDLMSRHGAPKPGYDDDGIRACAIRLGGPEMGAYYDRLCRSVRPLPIGECLESVGLRMRPADEALGLELIDGATDAQRRLRRVWLYGTAEVALTPSPKRSPKSVRTSNNRPHRIGGRTVLEGTS